MDSRILMKACSVFSSNINLPLSICMKPLNKVYESYIQECESSDFNLTSDLFLPFTVPHFQTFNALKSTSFQVFQIIKDFFRLFLTDTLTPLYIISGVIKPCN